MAVQRREFLGLGALAAGGALLRARVAFALPDTGKSRFVLVILRGALDGLAAVPPLGDRDYPALRREFALRPPGESGGALPLGGFFGLHPAFAFLQQCYAARELIVLHALASPYRERSHFDGQDVLENGSPRPHALQTGWLNRALGNAPRPAVREAGVALGQSVPLVMRGPAAVTSWSRSKLTGLDDDTLARITDLYAGDALLATRLADALAALIHGHGVGVPPRTRQRALHGGGACGCRIPAPRGWPEGGGVRYPWLGYSCQRGRRAGPTCRPSRRARRRTRDLASGARRCVAAQRGTARH